ncbi:MAG: DUF3288 family protein [Geitlerinemataceae cyanobacterium]
MATPDKIDRRHPQAHNDKLTIRQILTGEQTSENLAELARLRIRYRGFPGAYDIQNDLAKALERWELTEEELFAKTREIHAGKPIYKARTNKKDEEDWS